jgi:3-dehydroquinate synthase
MRANVNTLERDGRDRALRYDGISMTRVKVAVEPRPYDVLIERGLLWRAGAVLREQFPDRRICYVVTVAPVRRKWGAKLVSALVRNEWEAKILVMPDGERHKRMATVEALAEKLIALGADRNALILALGGGMVGDVTGFLASVYMRGVDVVQIPTTFLAQVDASIGGKTGVNLTSGKNLVGTFHQPRAVLIDPDVLSTLPQREFRSGLYEALKCGVIGKPELFRRFEERRDAILRRNPDDLEYLITESVSLKAEVVSADERESGLRQVLNFGHTIGHALEADTNYRHFLHGEAVACGMIAAVNIAGEIGMLSDQLSTRMQDAVQSLGSLPSVRSAPKRIIRSLRSDKKTKNGLVHFVLPTAIGKVEIIRQVPEAAVFSSINKLRALFR